MRWVDALSRSRLVYQAGCAMGERTRWGRGARAMMHRGREEGGHGALTLPSPIAEPMGEVAARSDRVSFVG